MKLENQGLKFLKRRKMIHKVHDDLAINFPFVPDMIQAYKFGLCTLCEQEKEANPDFDNKSCPHCRKETKIMHWVSKNIGK